MGTEIADLQALLDEFKISKTRQEKIMAIVEPLASGDPVAFLPTTSRGCVVDRVEVYGLAIEVDANGRAARVSLVEDQHRVPHSQRFDVEWSA